MIHDLIIKPISLSSDSLGRRLEILPSEALAEAPCGSLQMEVLYPGAVQGWHKSGEVEWVCAIRGMIKLVLFDDRRQSPTFGELQELFIGEYDVQVVRVPGGVYYGWKLLSGEEGWVLRLPTRTDAPRQALPHDSPLIPYRW